ncbi:MAG: ABC transporter permease, partial [Lachnospiraceae bacterium]
MLKVNNKKTIHKLAANSLRANKLRNLFAVIAIILTTVLFTGLFTVVGSLLSSMEESTMRQVGSNFHGVFKYLTAEQYDKLKTHPDIKSISYSVVLGVAENEKLAKRPTEIRYANDEIEAAAMFSLPTTGRLPQTEDELATDTLVLERLGIPAELGQKVTLEYSVGDEKRMDTFTLVGFWQGDQLMSASQAWLARDYVEKQLARHIPADKNVFIGKINADVKFANSFRIESKLIQVITDSGYTPDEIAYGVNWAYTGNSGSADMSTILGGAGAILMIVLCGYLMISNVFAISIAKDIRFYGLLKTIGTTGKQIRFFLRRQASLLCLVGVPLGLFAGYFVGALLTPIVLSILNTNVIKITANPLAFLLSAFFAVFTVVISVRKPSKMAAKVSPIEALHSTDGAQKSRKTNKKSGGIKLW